MIEGAQILERLLADGRLARDAYDRVRAEAQRSGEHAADVAVDFGYVQEAELLRWLATLVRTQFVGTEKLAKAQIERSVLELVPVRVAERLKVFPLLFDRKSSTLSVATCALDVHDVGKQLGVVTQAREVKCYVARPRAIHAAIRRNYYGDASVFRAMLTAPRAAPASDGRLDVGYGDLADADFDELAPPPTPARGTIARAAPVAALPPGFEDIPGLGAPSPAPSASPARPAPIARPAPEREAPASGPPAIQISAPDFFAGMATASAYASEPAFEPATLPTPTKRADAQASFSTETLIETVHVLVSLLEQSREELRGHSAHVARVVRAVAERMGLPPASVHELVLAAHLHDLGKASTYHLTALNVAQYDGHRLQAQRSCTAPIRMLESASLPESTTLALRHMYERQDGGGLPDRLTGKDIPLGARILAAVDTYVDVTTTTKNPYRKRLTPAQACEGLGRFAGTIFDETVLDVLRRVALGDDPREKGAVGRRVLIVDADPEESTVLEMRLAARDLEVRVVRDAAAALAAMSEDEIDLVVADVELGDRDGFWLIERLRAGGQPDVPVILHTRRGDRESVARGFELGVADYVVKPASPDVVAAKVHKTLEVASAPRLASRGVSGSLREMSLADVLQLLANGRKSGRLTIAASGVRGDIGFAEGQVFEASFGAHTGEEAVYAMLVLEDGDFAFDTSYVPRANVVNVSAESLLLEGMRRIDESRR